MSSSYTVATVQVYFYLNDHILGAYGGLLVLPILLYVPSLTHETSMSRTVDGLQNRKYIPAFFDSAVAHTCRYPIYPRGIKYLLGNKILE